LRVSASIVRKSEIFVITKGFAFRTTSLWPAVLHTPKDSGRSSFEPLVVAEDLARANPVGSPTRAKQSVEIERHF
jgi:hypothetical protein